MIHRRIESKWAAVGPDWYRNAACRNTNSDQFTPVIETSVTLAKIKKEFCDICPVRERCLQFAIISGDRGYWGGTSTAERTAMRRVRSRSKCPITTCRAPDPVILGTYQVCIRCGASWQTDKDAPEMRGPEPISAA